MKKIRVGVSISEDVWGQVKDEAWRRRKSASQYVEDLLKAEFTIRRKTVKVPEIGENDKTTPGQNSHECKRKMNNRSETAADRIRKKIKSDEEVLNDANERLKNIQKEQGIKSYSKETQLGKK